MLSGTKIDSYLIADATSFPGCDVLVMCIADVRGHVVRAAGAGQPQRAAAVVAAAGAAGLPPAPLPQRRLHAVPQPAPAALGAAPLRRVPGLVPVRLAAGAPRRAAARLAGALRRQALRLRAVRPELQVPLRLRQAPRAEPPRQAARRQIVYLRCLRYAVSLFEIIQKASS